MRLAAAHIGTVQFIEEVASTEVDDHLCDAAAAPVAAGIAVHAADAEDVEILIEECVAVAVQADEREDRISDGLRERQRLVTRAAQCDDVRAGRAVVNDAAGIGGDGVVATTVTVLVVVDPATGLVEADTVAICLGDRDGRCRSGNRALSLEARAGIKIAASPVRPVDWRS